MLNRLAHENSPYLRQHADNPVDWYPWGTEALQRAQAEDKPILLSIGYAACHWCHVMAHESFEDAATAVATQDSATTMQSANDVSAAVVELFGLYNPMLPVDIGRLDVLERQVILDVAADDYTAAMASLAIVQTVWQAVKPSVLAHEGQDASAQFEASLAIQANALEVQDSTTLTTEAKNGLEIVDAFERLYR